MKLEMSEMRYPVALILISHHVQGRIQEGWSRGSTAGISAYATKGLRGHRTHF